MPPEPEEFKPDSIEIGTIENRAFCGADFYYASINMRQQNNRHVFYKTIRVLDSIDDGIKFNFGDVIKTMIFSSGMNAVMPKKSSMN